MRMRRPIAAVMAGIALSTFTAEAAAKSSTSISITINGDPKPGNTVIVRATLTGSHIVTGPYPTYPGAPNYFPSGSIVIAANGVTMTSQLAGLWNSYASCEPLLYTPPFDTICHGPLTIVDFAYAIPKGTSSRIFAAAFLGDPDSHGSTSTPVEVNASYPSITPVLDLLLKPGQ
ncbi:hypothetical protein [Frateuria sp. Soil773]|uniref:hypothetical protein n=1 Tax=Frateuria sp. Soil773 TaxID=1736407 RepID=UPI0012F95905|nr:hypothetical protein [Frateuria sp. Soil773]